ncbi:Uncharacterized protein PBTT_05939 [Plasmodiophora brassicae]|uniref:Uncharacterized protein n=1 Tax=Plasmodiophora brassicae TaxID=37360 RepID=A0A0G4J342_PLABS|nr:hypothetical protein PBRA_002207 [Plasmodiophora brassicae]
MRPGALFIGIIVVLVATTAFAGETSITVEHGDGHVDNTNESGVHHIFGDADHRQDVRHHGAGHSAIDHDGEFGQEHRDDVADGDHHWLHVADDLPPHVGHH